MQALKLITLYAGPVAALCARMVGWQVIEERVPNFDPAFPCTWKQYVWPGFSPETVAAVPLTDLAFVRYAMSLWVDFQTR